MKNITLSFVADKAEILEEFDSSRFSIMRLSCFASGENAHGIGLEDDVLRKAEKTIHNIPLVWHYDPIFDDAEGHNILEVPGGFIPQSSSISYERLEDNRLMMIVERAVIWKKYSGKLMEIFERDGGEKSVSVEISVIDSDEGDDKSSYNIRDFQYEAVTILGEFHEPAIEGAKIEVVEFSKGIISEYESDYEKEYLFSSGKYSGIDFSIPEVVRENIALGVELNEELGFELTSVVVGYSKGLLEKKSITSKKAKYIKKHMDSFKCYDCKDTYEYVCWMLLGGGDGFEWLDNLSVEMKKADNRISSYFGLFKSNSSSNFYKRSVSMKKNKKEEGIDKEDEALEFEEGTEDEEENAYLGEDGEKEGEDKEEDMSDDSDKEKDVEKDKDKDKEEDMSGSEKLFSLNSYQVTEILNMSMSEYKYSSGDYEYNKFWVECYDKEFAYVFDCERNIMCRIPYSLDEDSKTAEVDMEKSKDVVRGNYVPVGEEVVMYSLDEYLDVQATLAFLNNSTEVNEEMANGIANEQISGNIGEFIKSMKIAYEKLVVEKEGLTEFKDDVVEKQFNHRVESVLADVSDSMDTKQVNDLREKSKDFTVETFGDWENLVKATAFENSKGVIKKDPDAITRMSNPFVLEDKKDSKKNELLW